MVRPEVASTVRLGGLALVGLIALALALAVAAAAAVMRSQRRLRRELTEATARVRAEVQARIDALEAERSAREAILASLGEGVVLFDAGGGVRYRNNRAGELIGGDPDHAQTLPTTGLRDLMERATRGETPAPVEVVVGPDARTLHATATPVGDGRVLLVLRDVTTARRLDDIRRDFVANASHELKTPAASIRALAETLVAVSESDPDEVPRFAGQLEREAVRLSRIVTDLLDLSRLEGPMVEGKPLRLDQVVSEEAGRLRERSRRAGLTLSVQAEPVVVLGPPRELALLIRNLVENALQYTRPGGRVDVRVGPVDAAAVLSVSDTGIGIPARDLTRIFERFYRVDRARSRETGGTGLGLSIVKHVAESLGGTVHVESRLGEGSTFTVRLPRAE